MQSPISIILSSKCFQFGDLIYKYLLPLHPLTNMKLQNQGKKIIQSRKKIRSKPKTACKTVKADKFSHPSYQNPNRSDIEVTSGAKRVFAAMLCVAWRRKLPLRRKRNCGTQKGKTENHIEYQIQKPKSIFEKNRRPNAKNRKMRKPQ